MSPPNQLTIIRILLTPVFLGLLFSTRPLYKQLALAVFVVASLTDWYDGWVARKWGYISRWGRFLDPLADKILTSAAFIAFLYLGFAPAWMVWIIVIRDLAITALRSYAEYKEKPVTTSWSAKMKTVSQFVVIYYILLLYTGKYMPPIRDKFGDALELLLNSNLLYALMLIVTILTAWTGISYLFENRKTLRELYGSVGRATEPQ